MSKTKWERTEFDDSAKFYEAIKQALTNLFEIKAHIKVKQGKRTYILKVRSFPGEF